MKAGIALVALIASTVSSEAVEGRYKVEGQNPGQAQIYRGDAIIKRTGDTYSVVWQIGSGRQIGTGIRTGSVLSVVFQAAAGAPGGGVASFLIVDETITSGQWAVTGGNAVGVETWSIDGAI